MQSLVEAPSDWRVVHLSRGRDENCVHKSSQMCRPKTDGVIDEPRASPLRGTPRRLALWMGARDLQIRRRISQPINSSRADTQRTQRPSPTRLRSTLCVRARPSPSATPPWPGKPFPLPGRQARLAPPPLPHFFESPRDPRSSYNHPLPVASPLPYLLFGNATAQARVEGSALCLQSHREAAAPTSPLRAPCVIEA